MKSNIIHSIVVCLLAFTLPLMVACSSQEESLPGNATEAALYLNVATIEQTRAGMDKEKMHSLRVIILHDGEDEDKGNVEYNRLYSLDGPLEEKTVLLRVKPNENKKIFLFANEENISKVEEETDENQTLTQIFESFGTDAPGFEEAVNKLYFAPQDGNIPMASVYELKADELQAGKQIEKTFYLVRVMTKFTFSFINGRTDGPIKVTDMQVSAFADKMYLMPHLHDGSGTDVPSEEFTVVDQKKEITDKDGTMYEPVLNNPYNGTYQAGGGTFWIDWLKQAVDWSQNETAGYTADQIGWISQYSVPSSVQYDVDETKIKLKDIEIKMGEEYQYPTPFYRCESMNTPSAETQEYQIDYLKITYGVNNEEKEWTASETAALKLTNVRYLFRHTHVKVNVTFNQQDVAIFARIYPWNRSEPVPPRPLEPDNN